MLKLDSLAAILLHHWLGLHLPTSEIRSSFSLSKGWMLLLYQPVNYSKRSENCRWVFKKCRTQLDDSEYLWIQWITDSPMEFDITLLTLLFLLFLILLISPYLINFSSGFLQQQIEKISKQTLNKLLLQVTTNHLAMQSKTYILVVKVTMVLRTLISVGAHSETPFHLDLRSQGSSLLLKAK